jgi:hypothetical protein
MKNILLVTILISVYTAQAQDFLGTWSFESVDREAVQDGEMSEEELDKRLNMVSNMFSSMKLVIEKNGAYTITMLGREKEYIYTENENILLLKEGKLEILTTEKAKYTSGNAVLFLQKGDV